MTCAIVRDITERKRAEGRCGWQAVLGWTMCRIGVLGGPWRAVLRRESDRYLRSLGLLARRAAADDVFDLDRRLCPSGWPGRWES